MNHLFTDRILSGFSPITSTNLAKAPESCTYLGVLKGDYLRFSLRPSYKGNSPCLFLNIFRDGDSATRANEVLFRAREDNGGDGMTIRVQESGGHSHGNPVLTVTHQNLSPQLSGWIAALVRTWQIQIDHNHKQEDPASDPSFSIINPIDPADPKFYSSDWDRLFRYAQPINNPDWVKSLTPSDYRGMASRWTGQAVAKGLTKVADCTHAICHSMPHAITHSHPWCDHGGFPNAYSGGARCTSSRYSEKEWNGASLENTGHGPVLSGSSYVCDTYEGVGHSCLVAPKSTTPTPAPATPTTRVIPPMPSMASSITDQIDALTSRAEAADVLAKRVDELIEEVNVLKNKPQVTIHSGPNFTGSGKVDIAGKEMDHFDLKVSEPWGVPSISPQYCLKGWRSNFSVGDLSVDYTLGDVMSTILSGAPTRLIGPPATGKTSGIQQACAHMNVPCRTIQCGKGLTEYTLLGEQTIKDGEVVWQDGLLPRLCKAASPDAPHVVIFDEGDHLKAEIQSILHGVLEGGVLDLPNGESVTVPSSMIFVMTANTYGTGDITGRHTSANVSDDAFISRWTRAFTVDYLDEAMEKDLLISYGVPSEHIDKLQQFVSGTRSQARKIDSGELSDGVRTPVTLRSLIPFAQDCASGVDPKAAFCSSVMGQFSPDELKHVRELVRACLGW